MKIELTVKELNQIIEALFIDIESGAEEKRPLYDRLSKIQQNIN